MRYKVGKCIYMFGQGILVAPTKGVVALLNILMSAFKDGIFLDGLDSLLFLNAAKTSFSICLTSAEVNSALDLNSILSASP